MNQKIHDNTLKYLQTVYKGSESDTVLMSSGIWTL